MVEANLFISLDVECPHCDHYFDLINDTNLNEEGHLLQQACPSNEHWVDAHRNFKEDVNCPECGKEINITSIGW